MLISPQIKSLSLFHVSLIFNTCCLYKTFLNEVFIHSISCAMCQLCASENPLQSLFWRVWGSEWLSRVLSEVNVHGLHSGILGVVTEEVPPGERLFAAISLSLFLTTRLPQQMAPTLTLRHCEAMKSCVGRYNTKMCSEFKSSQCGLM